MPGHVRVRSSSPEGGAPPRVYAFDDFELDPADAALRRGGAAVALTPKAFGVLAYLVAHAGRLVTKDEFMERVWPGVFVGDAALKVCVREIRLALGDEHKTPRYIETVHRRGYRFVAPVTVIAAAPPRPAVLAAEYHPADALRAERRRQHRLPGGRRRAHRPRVRHGLGLAPRLLLGRALVRALPAPAGVVLAADPVRQARHGPVRSRRRAADARAADGRRARGARRRRLAAGGAARRLRGRPAVRALRDDVSGADAGARDDRHLRQAALGARLPVGADRGAGRARSSRRSAAPGAARSASRRARRGARTIRPSATGGAPTCAWARARARRWR